MNIILFLIVQGWVVFIMTIHQLIMLLASFEPESLTPQDHLLAGGLKILFILVPLLLLALYWPHPTYRVVYRTWVLAACSLLFFLPISLLDPSSHQLRTVLHLPGLGLLAIMIFLLDQRRITSFSPAMDPLATNSLPFLVFLFCGIYALPWLSWGALGSIFDSGLQLLLGFSFGITGALLLETLLFQPLSEKMVSPNRIGSYFLLGFASSTAFFLLAGAIGFPFGSLPVILMLVASGLGWLVTGLRMYVERIRLTNGQGKGSWINLKLIKVSWILAGMCCFVLSMPLLMFDPDELGLFLELSSQEILRFAFQSTAISFLVIMIFALAALLLVVVSRKLPPTFQTKPLGASRILLYLTLALLVFCGNLLVYFRSGQPGFHGERLFIILKNQADLSTIEPQAEVGQRRQAVYDLLVEHSLVT